MPGLLVCRQYPGCNGLLNILGLPWKQNPIQPHLTPSGELGPYYHSLVWGAAHKWDPVKAGTCGGKSLVGIGKTTEKEQVYTKEEKKCWGRALQITYFRANERKRTTEADGGVVSHDLVRTHEVKNKNTTHESHTGRQWPRQYKKALNMNWWFILFGVSTYQPEAAILVQIWITAPN